MDDDVDANNQNQNQNNNNIDDDENNDENQIRTKKDELNNDPELFLNNDDDKEKSRGPQSPSPSSSSSSSMSTGLVIIATIIFTSFWPLLAVLRSTSNPIDGFDIDMFIALKGILDNTTPDVSALGLDADYYNPVIMELPPLSPAEQLVGAIFGPP